MSWQLSCHDICKIVIWLDNWNHDYNKENFLKISVMNSLTLCEMNIRSWSASFWCWPTSGTIMACLQGKSSNCGGVVYDKCSGRWQPSSLEAIWLIAVFLLDCLLWCWEKPLNHYVMMLWVHKPFYLFELHIGGLMQQIRNFIANALGLCLSCTHPSICCWSLGQ